MAQVLDSSGGGSKVSVAAAKKNQAKKAPAKSAKPKSNSWGNVAKSAASGGVGGGGGGRGAPNWGDVGMAAGVGGAGFQSSPDVQAIMRQSGSTDPSDPYNWKGIAAGLAAQAAAQRTSSTPTFGGGSSGGGGTSMPSAPTPVIQAPSTVTTPPQVQPPSAITASAQGAVGAPTGQTFNSVGQGGTFGQFDRMRNQRQPRSGLSVTPEMLRAAARARQGSM